MDQVKIRRTPRFERPPKNLFVETPGAFDIVGLNGEVTDVIGHDEILDSEVGEA